MKFILNKKNTIIFLAAIFVFNFSFFSFAENYSFSDLDLVLLGKGNEAENTFVIGDGCQSFTEKRTVTQFYLNRFETTYDLWYSIRTAAESLGYTFLNPGRFIRKKRRSSDRKQQISSCYNDKLVRCSNLVQCFL